MIKLNYSKVQSSMFPDGTWNPKIPYDAIDPAVNTIEWRYQGEYELSLLQMIALHLKEVMPMADNLLEMPYVPNSRMDRTKHRDEVFTLKHFAQIINSLGFKKVVIRDPHSPVVTALIDRVECEDMFGYINFALVKACNGDPKELPMIFYPDYGAVRRYKDLNPEWNEPYGYGVKFRNWDTRALERLVIAGNPGYEGHSVMIVDDICCSGGTAIEAAKVLKSVGAKQVFLYVTHLEVQALNNDELFENVERVFTTNPLFYEEALAYRNITLLGYGGNASVYGNHT